MLDAEIKRLHKKGLGTNPNQSWSNNKSLLWAKDQLGTHSGTASPEYRVLLQLQSI